MNGRTIFRTFSCLTFKQIMQVHNTILMTITMINIGTITKEGVPTVFRILS